MGRHLTMKAGRGANSCWRCCVVCWADCLSHLPLFPQGCMGRILGRRRHHSCSCDSWLHFERARPVGVLVSLWRSKVSPILPLLRRHTPGRRMHPEHVRVHHSIDLVGGPAWHTKRVRGRHGGVVVTAAPTDLGCRLLPHHSLLVLRHVRH